MKGTVGVLLEAKKQGLIDMIKPLLYALQEKGLYLGILLLLMHYEKQVRHNTGAVKTNHPITPPTQLHRSRYENRHPV